jgi:membrane protease YdiL (CAAX protease family)
MTQPEAESPPAQGADGAPRGPIVTRGLLVCLVVTYGVAWTLWALLWLGGGLERPEAGAFLLASMYAPALGVVAAWRLADPEALRVSGLRRRGTWRWYLIPYALIPLLLVLGAALCVLVGLQQIDPTFSGLREQAARMGVEAPPPPSVPMALLMALPAFLLAPLINVVATIGEELGWRGYLWARVEPLGPRRAAALIGVVWGVWHAPLIAMGFNYPGAPVLGPLLMTGLTLTYGVILGWLRARSGSVWPAALAHGAMNAQAGAVGVFLTPVNPLIGAPIGVVALLPAAAFAAWLLWWGNWEASDPPARLAGAMSPAPPANPG